MTTCDRRPGFLACGLIADRIPGIEKGSASAAATVGHGDGAIAPDGIAARFGRAKPPTDLHVLLPSAI